MRTPAVRNGLLAGLVALIACLPLAAEEREAWRWPLEIGLYTGFAIPDDHLTQVKDSALEPLVGVHVGGRFRERYGWFAQVEAWQFESLHLRGDGDVLSGRAGFEVILTPRRKYESFFSGSWGYSRLTFDNATDFVTAAPSVGLGQHIQIGASTRLRWETRYDFTLADDGLAGEDLRYPVATIGVNWLPGKRKLDADGDGIPGNRDRCRDTPAGVPVNERGCPTDSDRDGVFDGLDACPETPRDWPVDAAGCPLDGDGDGVVDLLDQCAATPRGAKPDDKGCPSDGDGDGVFDGLDKCPGTLRGIEVDERGCFLDADEDGVYDGLGMDRCPGTPKGVPVDPFGCPLKDADGS